MARTVIAVFDSIYSAVNAKRELEDSGLSNEGIDVFVPPDDSASDDFSNPVQVKRFRPEVNLDGGSAGAQVGMGIGGAIGAGAGLLVWLGTIALPASVLALGPWSTMAAAWTAAVLSLLGGGILGGLAGSMIGLAIPEGELLQYAKIVHERDVLLSVQADWEAIDPIIEVLSKFNPLALEEKTYRWNKPESKGKKPAYNPMNMNPREHHDRR